CPCDRRLTRHDLTLSCRGAAHGTAGEFRFARRLQAACRRSHNDANSRAGANSRPSGGLMRKSVIVAVAAALFAIVALPTSATAQSANERVRKINLYTWPQAALPQIFQASQLIAQQWRQLGLDVEVKPLQRQAQTQLIWYSRDKWDV